MIDEDKIKQQLIAEMEKFCREIEGKAKSEAEYKKEVKKLQERTVKPCRQVDQRNGGELPALGLIGTSRRVGRPDSQRRYRRRQQPPCSSD